MRKAGVALGILFSLLVAANSFAIDLDPNLTLTIANQASGGGKAVSFSVQQLKDLIKQGSLREVTVRPVIMYGEMSGDFGVWSFTGVSLRDLVISTVGYAEDTGNALYKMRKQLYLACYASDGYSGVVSWAELLLGPMGDTAIVAYSWEMLRGPNSGAEPKWVGDFVLVVPTDVFTGAREVQALKSIELRAVGKSALAK